MLTKKSVKQLSNEKQAKAVFDALSVETGSAHEKRAKTTLTVKNSRLEITSVGTDATYVKASQDTYGKLVEYLQSLKH